eukprot:scaffold93352_cov18-Prasinocladus_malaysianus.AAC.1
MEYSESRRRKEVPLYVQLAMPRSVTRSRSRPVSNSNSIIIESSGLHLGTLALRLHCNFSVIERILFVKLILSGYSCNSLKNAVRSAEHLKNS